MSFFKTLDRAKATRYLQKILNLTNSFPLGSSIDAQSTLINNYIDFLNVIHYVSTKDKAFSLVTRFTTDSGHEDLDIVERSEILIKKLFEEIKNKLSIESLTTLISASNSILKTTSVKLFHKTNIIDAENSFLKNRIEDFIGLGNEGIIRDFINLRLEIILDSIYEFEDKMLGDHHFNQNNEALFNILNLFIGFNIDFHIYRNQIFQIYSYLREEFELNEDERIRKIFLDRIINLNNRFLLEPKAILKEILEESELFSGEELEFQRQLVESNPMSGNMYSLSFSQGSITKQIVSNNKIITILRFSIPYGIKKAKKNNNQTNRVQLNHRVFLEYSQIVNRFSDPVFRMFKDLSIGGMPWDFFSDTFDSDTEEFSTLAVVIDDFYHPDFEFDENGTVDIDFSEKTALTGREYYPHKEYVIKLFLDNFSLFSDIFSIEKKDLNINLFSNFVLDYHNINSNSTIFRKLYTITNPDSFEKVADKFIERLNEVNLSNAFIPIKDLINNTKIISDKSLSTFLKVLIEIVLKNNIEQHSNYKYFWKNNKNGDLVPQSEPDMQPLIKAQLASVCDYVGIQVSREAFTANGEVDFLCSFTYNGKILKTCVELKNAHSEKYELGLTKQLPAYLKSERTKSGIYVVLWYKGDIFHEPNKFSSISDLNDYLYSKRPSGFKIEIVSIDCSRPIVPSKLV